MSSEDEAAGPQHVNTRSRQHHAAKTEKVSGIDYATATPLPKQIKTPPFWAEKPNIWFRQVEGQFKMFGITDDETKFYQVLTALDRQYASEVEDVITGPPDYNRLKTELIKRLSASRENKIRQLVTHEQIGERKPSQFLRHLQHLAGPDTPEDFLKTLWTSRLPSEMQPIVASQPTLSLDALADLADRIYDIAAPPKQLAATAGPSAIDLLTQQVSELSKQVSSFLARDAQRSRNTERGRTHGRARERSRGRSPRRRSSSNYRKFPKCWYHAKYGAQATRCVKPCDFSSGNEPSGR